MEEIKCEQVGQIVGSGFTEMTGRVYSVDGLTPSIRTFGGGNTEVKIAEPIIYDDYNGRVRADQDCIGTLTTNCGNDALRNGVKIIEPIIVDEIYNNREPRVYHDHCPTIRAERQGLEVIEPIAYDEQNGYLRQDGCVGTLTTDGSSPKHNNRIVEPNYRFFEQAFETLQENNCEVGDTIDAFNKRVNKDGVSPTITTRPDGFKTAILPVVPTVWGSLQKNCAKKTDGICPTLTSAMGDGGGQIPMHNYDYRIRKLTERECFRLMGVKSEDFERVAKNQSTSALYHEAGDALVTTVLMAGRVIGYQ